MSISPDWDILLDEILREPALVPFARDSAVILWGEDGQTVLYANEPGALLVGLSARPGSAARMSLLARHLAPLAGVRLERLTFSADGKPVTAACRRLDIKGFGPVLVTLSSSQQVDVTHVVSATEAHEIAAPHEIADLIIAAPAVEAGNMAEPEMRAIPEQSPIVTAPEPMAVETHAPTPAPTPAPRQATPALRPKDTVRFLWDVDAEGRMTRLSHEFSLAFGQDYADTILGAHWQELAASEVHDPDGAVARALQHQQTWSGLTVLWRLPGTATGVEVDLSGLPYHDAERRFSGFRGFGIARMNRVEPMHDLIREKTGDAIPGNSPPGMQTYAPASISVPMVLKPLYPQMEPHVSFSQVAPSQVPPPQATPGETIVPLRPANQHTADPSALLKPALSPSERNAFRDIARALGARMADEPTIANAVNASGAASHGPVSENRPAAIVASIPAISAVPTANGDGYAELLDKLPIGVLVSRGQRSIYANQTLLLLLGYDTFNQLAALDTGHLFKGTAPEEGGGPIKLIAQDGGTVPVDARLSAITWNGLPATLMAFRRVVEPDAGAGIKALELDLARRNAELAELTAILNTATDGVVTLDERGRLLSMNSAAEALFGYDQNEVVGEPVTLLLAGESHGPALDYLEGLNGGGVASVMNDGREVLGRVRQGGTITLSMTMGRIREGRNAKFCAVLRDMTAWKKVESDLTAAKKAAEAASTQKSDILAKISHEIRTPLNAIIGFSEVMSSESFGPIGNDRYKEYLGDIRDSGNYVISLVNDLLDLAKIEAGRLDLDFVSVSLNDIATSAVALLQPEAARGRVVLRTGLTQKLPPVVADQRSLRQIVINLLSNAVKFTDAGGQVIVSTALGDRGEALLRVRDTGIGMDEKELKLALEPFRQVPNTRKAGGTGLGLPLTKALIEANRGEMLMTSVKGEGTLVEVVFPPQRVLAR
jgi:PAS domain S-box-containing protein